MTRRRGWVDRTAIVLADTSVFRRFADGGALLSFMFYVDERLRILRDVEQELAWRDVRMAVTTLQARTNAILDLPMELLREAAETIKRSQVPGDPARKNAGEVATALMARHLRDRGEDVMVLMDDQVGKNLLVLFELRYETTAELVVEMACNGALDDATAVTLYTLATPDGVGEREFRDRLASFPRQRAQ